MRQSKSCNGYLRYRSTPLILTRTYELFYNYDPHFTDEQTKAERRELTCLTHSSSKWQSQHCNPYSLFLAVKMLLHTFLIGLWHLNQCWHPRFLAPGYFQQATLTHNLAGLQQFSIKSSLSLKLQLIFHTPQLVISQSSKRVVSFLRLPLSIPNIILFPSTLTQATLFLNPVF